MTDSHNKIAIPNILRILEDREDQGRGGGQAGTIASRDLILLLNHVVRKLNAVDSLDSSTATAATIVQALQK